MARPEWTYLIDGIIDNHGSAQEFHRALVNQSFLVVNKSGETPDHVFTELFDHMGEESLKHIYTTPQGKPILYLPVHLDRNGIINLANKSGLPEFNAQLARVAATVPEWITREVQDTYHREKVLHEKHVDSDAAIIEARLDYDLKFTSTDFASTVIRRILARFGNPPDRFESSKIPSIVPIFNFTEGLPEGFKDTLERYDTQVELSHEDRTTALLCRSIVNLVHHMQQTRGKIPVVQYILAGSLQPYEVLAKHRYDTVDPWLQYGPNSELLYVYESMKVVEI